jgi:hypothetical protein
MPGLFCLSRFFFLVSPLWFCLSCSACPLLPDLSAYPVLPSFFLKKMLLSDGAHSVLIQWHVWLYRLIQIVQL